MVKVRCLILFLVSTTLALSCVSAVHPMAKAMSHRDPQSESTSDSSSEEDMAEVGFRSVDAFPSNTNHLRFGKSGPPMTFALYTPPEQTEEEKRVSRNFLRFGRTPQRNFLRFGKSGPLQFGLGIEDDSSEEFDKRADARNFLRYSKAANRNFLRFGRSTGSQMKENCEDCSQGDNQTPSVHSTSSASSRKRGNSLSTSSDDNTLTKRSRSKRSISAFYDDVEFVPHTPLSWTTQYAGLVPESRSIGGVGDISNKDQKRSYSRSFLRYGRDPLDLHFLRFGKRGSPEDEKSSNEGEEEFPRYVRGRSSKNFIRFG